MSDRSVQVVAISGSLRRGSTNTALLEAARLVAPSGVNIVLYERIGQLPLFSPDLENDMPPEPLALRALLCASDAILIACPEYAHGVPGAFKNALDWLVSCPGLGSKPVSLLNASAHAVHAQAALAEILATMNQHLIAEACFRIPIAKDTAAWQIAEDPGAVAGLRQALAALCAVVIRA
jgi:NAD(P)H-dependent FMN reductase